jgi:hypothetical protein
LDLQAVCDGISDCNDKSDETKCSSAPSPSKQKENDSPEDDSTKTQRLRRQGDYFPDYNYDLYSGAFPTDFPMLDYGTTDSLFDLDDLGFGFETTPNPQFNLFNDIGKFAI